MPGPYATPTLTNGMLALPTTPALYADAVNNAVTALWNEGIKAVQPFRNRILNPCGQIAQAGLASTADGAYTGFDQWLALTQSNPVTPSQLANVVNGVPYMMRMTQANASAQRMGWLQWIESRDCIDLRGSSVQLSAWVRMSASTTLRYAIVEWTGTADSITKDIVNDWTSGTFTTGNFFKSTTTTIVATGSTALTANTIAAIYLNGTVSGNANNLAVFFWTDSAQAQNVTLDLTRAQLEVGAFATAFAPRSYGDELRACQRYYYKQTAVGVAAAAFFGSGYSFATNQQLIIVQFPVRMRVVPTMAFTAPGTFQFFVNNVTIYLASIAQHIATTTEVGSIYTTTGTALVANSAVWLLDGGVASATITYDARL